jgi:hypothetical protein
MQGTDSYPQPRQAWCHLPFGNSRPGPSLYLLQAPGDRIFIISIFRLSTFEDRGNTEFARLGLEFRVGHVHVHGM